MPRSLGGGERSTGTRDPVEATREASRICSEEFARIEREGRAPEPRRRASNAITFEVAVSKWLTSLRNTHAATTLVTWEGYASSHWFAHFGAEAIARFALTQDSCSAYIRDRLGKVRGVTVRKERTALGSLITWLIQDGELDHKDSGELLPKLPKKATGTAYHKRRRVAAFYVEPEQVRAMIRRLPEWSNSGRVERFAIRARFILAYETSLRPSTFDRLRCPEHYRIGESRLRLTEASDKARFARDVPLTRRARRVLDHVLRSFERAAGEPFEGLIFGEHTYTDHIRAAARATLPRELAERVTAAHFRSHALTHWIDQDVPLTAAQWMAGHKLISTTARYVKPSYRAAFEALERLGK